MFRLITVQAIGSYLLWLYLVQEVANGANILICNRVGASLTIAWLGITTYIWLVKRWRG